MTADRAFRVAAAIVAAVTLVRIVALFVSPLELYPDEAQYWWWAQHPALGYFSKPPLIAWIVAAVTSVFGDAEAAIRLASPLLHGGTALVLFAVAHRLYDAHTGLWTAVSYIVLPGAAYSSGIISTDVPLLFLWASALLAFARAMREPGWSWALVCGAAIGFGMLAKYAMLYFVAGAVLTAIVLPQARRLLLSRRGAAIGLIAAAIFSPNVVWNMLNGYSTVAHTAANAHWQDTPFNPVGALEFLGSQFGVFGPFMFGAYLFALWRIARGRDRTPAALLLAGFSLPPLAVILVQAFLSEANANWAATAYVAATPLAVHTLLSFAKGRVFAVSLGFNGLAALAMLVLFVSPAAVEAAGLANAYKRMHGWRELGKVVVARAEIDRPEAIVADNRSVVAELLYYARPRSVPVLAWDDDEAADDHFQLTLRLTPETSGRVLLVTTRDDPAEVLATFDSAQLVDTNIVPLGGDRRRVTLFFDAQGYRRPASSDGTP